MMKSEYKTLEFKRLNATSRNEILELEDEIIWLVNPETVEYVREVWRIGYTSPPKQLKSLLKEEILVGYAALPEALPPKLRWKCHRIFLVKAKDRYMNPNGAYKHDCPTEGVDPLTIEPRKKGIRNKRAIGN